MIDGSIVGLPDPLFKKLVDAEPVAARIKTLTEVGDMFDDSL